MKVAVIGAGFVGLPTAVMLAHRGNKVALVEKDEKRRDAIRAGHAPFKEPELDDLLNDVKKNLFISDLKEAVEGSEIIMVCLPTPNRKDGSQFGGYLAELFQEIREMDIEGKIFAIKSTVLPGTTEAIREMVAKKNKAIFYMAMCPEFLAEGTAMKDCFEPKRVVIGTGDYDAGMKIASLFENMGTTVYLVSIRTAEMVKYVANGFLAMRVSFCNEIANICDEVGVDAVDVLNIAGQDPRIGTAFMKPSAGYGGDCFPKDMSAFIRFAEDCDVAPILLNAVEMVNWIQYFRVIEMLREELGDLKGKKIAVLGLAFKAGTSDTRNSVAKLIVDALIREGAEVRAYDKDANPEYLKAVRVPETYDALKDADACVLQTEDDWSNEKFDVMKMRIIVDARRTGSGVRFRLIEVRNTPNTIYRGVGLPRTVG